MNTSITILTGLSFAFSFACASVTQPEVTDKASAACATSVPAAPRESRNLDSARAVIFFSDYFSSSVEFDASAVTVYGQELNPSSNARNTWDATTDAGFHVTSIGARHANELYVAGLDAANFVVLEKWLIVAQDGSFYTEKKVTSTPIGAAAEPIQTELKMVRPHVEPSLRAAPTLQRSVITVPSGWGDIRSIGADPEGRFLLALTDDAGGGTTLRQLDLSTGLGTALFDSSMVPFLVDAIGFQFRDSSIEGRLVRIGSTGFGLMFLVDEYNDGVFEDHELLGNAESEVAYPPYSLSRHP
jgi:hypothetical protein